MDVLELLLTPPLPSPPASLSLSPPVQRFEAGYDKDERTYTMCGSPEYLSPEQVVGGGSKGHGYASDYWSLGALMFEMLTGKTPFSEISSKGRRRSTVAADLASESELFDRIVAFKGDIASLPGADKLPADVTSIVEGLLNPDQDARLAFAQGNGAADGGIVMHPWFAGISWPNLTKGTQASPYAAKAATMLAERSAKEAVEEAPFAGDGATNTDEGGLLGVSAFTGF